MCLRDKGKAAAGRTSLGDLLSSFMGTLSAQPVVIWPSNQKEGKKFLGGQSGQGGGYSVVSLNRSSSV